jgi:hypothetical protein
MPWFSAQGLLLTGYMVTRFLATTTDLRSYFPVSSGGPLETQMLLAIAALFPASGTLAVCAALLGAARESLRVPAAVMLLLAATASLTALALGAWRLPAGTSAEIGLWVMGVASVAILVGAATELSSVQSSARPGD